MNNVICLCRLIWLNFVFHPLGEIQKLVLTAKYYNKLYTNYYL